MKRDIQKKLIMFIKINYKFKVCNYERKTGDHVWLFVNNREAFKVVLFKFILF